MNFSEDVLPLLISTLATLLSGVATFALAALGRWLKTKGDAEQDSALARMGFAALERLASEVDHAIDYGASATAGALARAQAPESPGGAQVTGEEWIAIRRALVQEVRDGLGQAWLSRLGDVFGVGVSELEKPIAKAIETRYRARALSGQLLREDARSSTHDLEEDPEAPFSAASI